jgi:hypothetical protein
MGQHPHRSVETRYAEASPIQYADPMTSATADFEYACREVPADERRQCVLYTRVVVAQIAPIVRVSDRVVVNARVHELTMFILTVPAKRPFSVKALITTIRTTKITT